MTARADVLAQALVNSAARIIERTRVMRDRQQADRLLERAIYDLRYTADAADALYAMGR
jgi:predicted nucleic acid-binding protein